jgi:hypothetical protein
VKTALAHDGTIPIMEKRDLGPGFPVDRDGEIFQSDLTDENEPSPSQRESEGHDENLAGEDVDSEAGDDFMRRKAAGEFP